MTFNQIKYFVTVAECLSFTEAAKCLFITQPALSRQINAMEEELGTRLFIREKTSEADTGRQCAIQPAAEGAVGLCRGCRRCKACKFRL